MAFPVKRYPANPITPHGSYWFLSGKKPMMTYRSYDGTSVFHLMGGMAIPDMVNAPESIRILEMSGLVPPWVPIEQKGATQDGVSFIDALYDPIDADMVVEARGKTPARTAALIRDWIAAWDAKQPGELSFFDQYAGRWWAPVRWTRNPVDKFKGGKFTRQMFTWPFKSHDAFWRSYDNVFEFRFGSAELEEDFDDLADWTLHYSGSGNGTMVVAPSRTGLLATILGPGRNQVTWQLGNNDQGRTVVAQRTGFTLGSDHQLVYMRLGSFPAWSFWDEAYNDIWVRMSNTGTPGDNGVRLRIQRHSLELSYFEDGVETTMCSRPLVVPPIPGETWCVAAGIGERILGEERASRTFTVSRGVFGLAPAMVFVERGTASPMGPGYRGVGFGMESGTGLARELPPASVRKFWAKDNTTQTQSGMLRRINMGDQPMWDRYTLHGPGMFHIGSGPGSTDMVAFGPLERGQVVQLRTDPRKRGVVDLTSVAGSPQQQKWWEKALEDFLSFAAGNNSSPLQEEILSVFGIRSPTNMYSLIDGRFTRPIPAKPAGDRAKVYNVLVQVVNGDADTRIIAAGTPLRRWPL